MKRIFHENGLSLVLASLFLLCLVLGQLFTGYRTSNEENVMHGKPEEPLGKYVMSAHFMEATFENWESEFLQMGVYVFLTAFLFQKGSAESKSPNEPEEVDRDPQMSGHRKDAPWPVRHGGWALKVYEHSLTLAFLLLFLLCFLGHALAGRGSCNEERLQHHLQALTTMEYMGSSRFWFESFQNWQSEFLAILSMVVLSIFLRQRGSPESKPVDAPHGETGG
ncbi:DUF6766 family protein [Roseimicrobium gellanilyticum]|nr:DUF6766 family protein [Roseimicrobium gellanilyticum]